MPSTLPNLDPIDRPPPRKKPKYTKAVEAFCEAGAEVDREIRERLECKRPYAWKDKSYRPQSNVVLNDKPILKIQKRTRRRKARAA